jgi:hypothetical protein
VGLATVTTAILEIGLLGRFVSTRDLRELAVVPDALVSSTLSSLPLHAGLAARADLLDLVFVVFVTVWTVGVKSAWHLHR